MSFLLMFQKVRKRLPWSLHFMILLSEKNFASQQIVFIFLERPTKY